MTAARKHNLLGKKVDQAKLEARELKPCTYDA